MKIPKIYSNLKKIQRFLKIYSEFIFILNFFQILCRLSEIAAKMQTNSDKFQKKFIYIPTRNR